MLGIQLCLSGMTTIDAALQVYKKPVKVDAKNMFHCTTHACFVYK